MLNHFKNWLLCNFIMHTKFYYLFILLLFRVGMLTGQTDNTLKVLITGLHSSNGSVLVSLFNEGGGFPSQAKKAFKKEKINIVGGIASATIKDIPPGTYAIAVLHDENNNLEMDTRLFGLPKEGYGFSNNAKGLFGPPSFKDARFAFSPDQIVKINIRY